MKIEDVVKKINQFDGLIDVHVETAGLESVYLFKECECEYDEINGFFNIHTVSESAILNVFGIGNYDISDESDDEFDQIVLNDGSRKLRLIFA